MKKYNFNAGPSILPREVIENTAKQILDFNGTGLSLAEISHRSKDFQPVVDEAEALIKEILNIPEGYSVLFLGGGIGGCNRYRILAFFFRCNTNYACTITIVLHNDVSKSGFIHSDV